MKLNFWTSESYIFTALPGPVKSVWSWHSQIYILNTDSISCVHANTCILWIYLWRRQHAIRMNTELVTMAFEAQLAEHCTRLAELWVWFPAEGRPRAAFFESVSCCVLKMYNFHTHKFDFLTWLFHRYRWVGQSLPMQCILNLLTPVAVHYQKVYSQ